MSYTKQALIIGGNGALGKAVVRRFKQDGWKVHSMDLNQNNKADQNIIVSRYFPMKDQAQTLIKQVSKQYDSIICVAGGFSMGNIKEEDIFEQHEHQDQINFQPALFAGHLASSALKDQGLLLLTGSAAVFEGPVNYAYPYYFAKTSTHALAMLLAERTEIPETSTVVTILPGILDTEANREAMADADKSGWAPPEKVAYLIRRWADGENRPTNGSYAKLIYEQESVYAKFI